MPEDRYMVVSADCHAGGGIADYKPYLEPRFHDEFDAWAASFHDKWVEVDPPADAAYPDAAKIGVASSMMTANWDSDQRVRDLEADGVVGEVVFPNTAPPFFPSGVISAGTARTRQEYDHRWAGLKAHNRWLVDFCNAVPGRRRGIAQILLNDIDDAVAEIEWVSKAGVFAGILVPLIEHEAPIPPLFTEAYDRIWAACVEFDVAAHQHVATTGLYHEDYMLTDAGKVMIFLESGHHAHRGLWHLIFGGAFERFPDLKFVMTEQGNHWIPEVLALLDSVASMGRDPKAVGANFIRPAVSKLSLTPSEYFARNVWIGASFLGRKNVEAGIIDVAGDRLMWGSDYPHSEGTFPSTVDFLSSTFFDRPVEETKAILGERAVDFYKFDRAACRAAADRVGPTIDRVLAGAQA